MRRPEDIYIRRKYLPRYTNSVPCFGMPGRPFVFCLLLAEIILQLSYFPQVLIMRGSAEDPQTVFSLGCFAAYPFYLIDAISDVAVCPPRPPPPLKILRRLRDADNALLYCTAAADYVRYIVGVIAVHVV